MPTPLLTPSEVFVPVQDLCAFEAFQAELAADFDPRCEFELHCVRTIAHSLWTIRRTRTLERRMQERAVSEGYVDPMLDLEWARQLRGVLNLRRQAERSQLLALKEFRAYRASHPTPPEEPAPAAAAVRELTHEDFAVAAASASAAATADSGAGNKVIEMPKAKRAAHPTTLETGVPDREVGLPPLQDVPTALPDRNLYRIRRSAARGDHHRLVA